MEKKILTESHIKEYFNRKKRDPALQKYANFNFLVYLAKVVDIPTAENIAKQIYEEKIDGEIIDSMIDTIIGYN